METGIKKTEQKILDEWRKYAESINNAHEFSEDGLLYRGNIFFEYDTWHRKEGKEEELWLNARRKLLIITKELNDTEAWNIREETGRQNCAAFPIIGVCLSLKTSECGVTDYLILLRTIILSLTKQEI